MKKSQGLWPTFKYMSSRICISVTLVLSIAENSKLFFHVSLRWYNVSNKFHENSTSRFRPTSRADDTVRHEAYDVITHVSARESWIVVFHRPSLSLRPSVMLVV